MKRIILAPVAALLCAASAMAQDSEPKFTIKPTGRILMGNYSADMLRR